jgi:hypothetical protein
MSKKNSTTTSKSLEEALIDLYLSVKIRKQDEVNFL